MVISTQWKTALGGSSVCYVLITTKYSTSCNLREDELFRLSFVSQKGWQQVDTSVCVGGVLELAIISAD